MLTVSLDRSRINALFKATVTVTSDEPFVCIEARATLTGEPYGRGRGYCLLSDDTTALDGVVSLSSAVSNYTFDVEAQELSNDGEYRVSVFVMNENGVWNDCCSLLTSSSQTVRDSDGAYILVKRNGTGTDEHYPSAFTGEVINNFIEEVIS